MLCRSANKGFTLLEIMVTVSIMAIVLVSIFDLHSQTISMNIDAKFYATAPFLAQTKLTERELTPLEDLLGDSGEFGADYPGFSWEINVEEVQPEGLTTSGIGFKKITVNIDFNDDELNYELVTYRYFYENQ